MGVLVVMVLVVVGLLVWEVEIEVVEGCCNVVVEVLVVCRSDRGCFW